MKNFIVTADIHIWFRKDVPFDWQQSRYEELRNTLIELCLAHDADLIIAGDLFEKARPTLPELQVALELFRHLKAHQIAVYLISGNHETMVEATGEKDGKDTFQHLDIGKDKTIKVCYEGYYAITIAEENTAITFLSHHMLAIGAKPVGATEGMQQILISHFRCDVNQFIRAEVDVEALLDPFDLCIAGDIHMPYEQGKLMYTNHPVNKEFEAAPQTGVVLLSLDKGKHRVERIKTSLPYLMKLTCTAEEFPPELSDRHYYEIEVSGSPADFRSLADCPENANVIRKVIMDSSLAGRNEDTTKPVDISLYDDLVLYMYELDYAEEMVAEMLSEFKEAEVVSM